MGTSAYRLGDELPEDALPSSEDLQLRIELQQEPIKNGDRAIPTIVGISFTLTDKANCSLPMKKERGVGLVYHYTSPQGALGILQNKTLWFTDCEFMNDPSELKYCYELYDRAWIEVSREFKVPEAKIEHEITRFANPYECRAEIGDVIGVDIPARYYSLSTCSNGDEAAMWANYACKDGKAGYSLAFDKDSLVQALERGCFEASKFGICAEVICDSVCYDEKAQIDDIKAAIRKYLIRLGETRAAGPDELDRIIASEIAWVDHWGWFGDVAPFIKNPKFAYEKEYRFVLKMAQIDQLTAVKAAICPHGVTEGDRKKCLLDSERFCGCRPESPIALHFHEGIAGAITPYLEIKLGEAWKDLLSAVRGQSYVVPDLVKDGMAQLVEDSGCKGVSIMMSDIRLRG